MRAPDDPNGVANDSPCLGASAERRWPLLLLALVAVALRLAWIEQPSWNDAEASTWQAVTQPWSGPGGFAASTHSAHPLVYLLLRWWIDAGLLPGPGEGWLRLPFAFVGALSVPLVALLARRFVGARAAWFAAAVVALHPTHIAWSQTADPASVAVTLTMVVGFVGGRRPVLAGLMLVLAGASHPIGWLGGFGWLVAARAPRGGSPHVGSAWWRGSLWALAALALPMVSAVGCELRTAIPVFAAVGIAVAPATARRLAVPCLLPLAVGGVTLLTRGVAPTALLLAGLPGCAILVGVGVDAAHRRCARLPLAGAWLRRGTALAPLLALGGELATATFLHFTIHQSGHAPWREAARTALRTVLPGRDLVVFAGDGATVLQVYLRPNHWRSAQRDLHPGVRVEPLRTETTWWQQLGEAFPVGGVLVLRETELALLRGDPALAPLLAQFTVKSMLPCPQPFGDWSVSVFERRGARQGG